VVTASDPVAPFFRWGEFPCWERATAADRARLVETVRRVLVPVRERWGPVIPTSWMWWRDGCVRRGGAHSKGGTVDFVVPGADLKDVHRWGIDTLLRQGYIGRWIYEPETETQGEHIHVAPIRDMIEAFGAGESSVLALVETPAGTYQVPTGGAPFGLDGVPEDVVEIDGLSVTVAGASGLPWGWWIGAGALVAALIGRPGPRE